MFASPLQLYSVSPFKGCSPLSPLNDTHLALLALSWSTLTLPSSPLKDTNLALFSLSLSWSTLPLPSSLLKHTHLALLSLLKHTHLALLSPEAHSLSLSLSLFLFLLLGCSHSAVWKLKLWGGGGTCRHTYRRRGGLCLKPEISINWRRLRLACERYGGQERETVSSWQGRRLVRARRAVALALRARPQLADRGTAGRYTSQGFYPRGPSAPGPSQVRRTGWPVGQKDRGLRRIPPLCSL